VISTPCPHAATGAKCGYLRVPLDRTDPSGAKIRIYFERYPRTDRSEPATSTVVSIEGGPGYSSTASRYSRLGLWRPVSEHRDLLLVDLRGTGRSHALSCPAFAKHVLGYSGRAGRCARQLGPSRDFYDTSQAVQDVAALARALHVKQIDLYGDSYGSYAAQAFAVRYPGMLRSLVLDSTYQLPGSDPAFTDLAQATRSSMRLACERRQGCTAIFGDPVRLVAGLLDEVRAQPISGHAPNGDGAATDVTVDAKSVANLIQSGYYYPGVWRDLPAAIVAHREGDDRPLLRLVAETEIADGPSGAPRGFSEALYLSVICHDYPELWSFSIPLDQRPVAVDQALAAYPARDFYPSTAKEWTGLDYEGALACLKWPSPANDDPPLPAGAVYPQVPALVLNGDEDNITPLADAQVVASNLPDSTLVVIQNSGHVTALGDQNGCASAIYVRFVRTLSAGNTSCARHTPEVRTVLSFPTRLGGVTPAASAAGDSSSDDERRAAAAAAMTVADALQRWWVNYSGRDLGLRSGHWSYSGYLVTTYEFRNAAFVPGVHVTGRAAQHYVGGNVQATLTVTGRRGLHERLHIRWTGTHAATATIKGSADGHPLRATMLAP